ncbi:hypothetical protein DL96DRAFT_518326 [Flagelloscypha sp. PMI_526]|nr:hypothetical protein DL96DRAFT_518326 [Flagelloscypha sp. PMI_526]
MEELDTHSCQISFHKDISPRHEKAGKYVQDLVVFGDNEYDQEEFVRLFSRLCNIIILELHSFKDSRFPLPHPTFPHLERLDAISPLSFGVVGNDSIVRPDFSAPIFRNLTHIYFTVSHSIQRMLDADWQWSLESMTRLLFIRLYVLLKEDNFGRFLPYFENHISRRFPRSLRGCLVCAEEGSSDMVDAFLAVDPRIVWAFRSDDLPDEDPSWEISRTRNRVFMYDIMRIDTEIMYDVWGEKMVEAIEKDRG